MSDQTSGIINDVRFDCATRQITKVLDRPTTRRGVAAGFATLAMLGRTAINALANGCGLDQNSCLTVGTETDCSGKCCSNTLDSTGKICAPGGDNGRCAAKEGNKDCLSGFVCKTKPAGNVDYPGYDNTCQHDTSGGGGSGSGGGGGTGDCSGNNNCNTIIIKCRKVKRCVKCLDLCVNEGGGEGDCAVNCKRNHHHRHHG